MVAGDKRNLQKLRKEGWKILTVWECQVKDKEKLRNKLEKFLIS